MRFLTPQRISKISGSRGRAGNPRFGKLPTSVTRACKIPRIRKRSPRGTRSQRGFTVLPVDVDSLNRPWPKVGAVKKRRKEDRFIAIEAGIARGPSWPCSARSQVPELGCRPCRGAIGGLRARSASGSRPADSLAPNILRQIDYSRPYATRGRFVGPGRCSAQNDEEKPVAEGRGATEK